MNIKKYKRVSWYNTKKKKIIFGIDVVMDNGSVFHVSDGKALFFDDRKEATKEVSRLNKHIKESDTTNDNTELMMLVTKKIHH
jgi:hypothetical protein